MVGDSVEPHAFGRWQEPELEGRLQLERASCEVWLGTPPQGEKKGPVLLLLLLGVLTACKA